MKKFITTVLATTLIFVIAQAQPYLRLGIGYALPSGSNAVGTEYSATYNSYYDPLTGNATSTSVGTAKAISGSYGSGFNLGASFGQLFGNNLGYDVELNYLAGKKYTFTEQYVAGPDKFTMTTSSHARSFSLTPSFVIVAGNHKLSPRIRVGLVLASNKLISELSSQGLGTIGEETIETKGGISLGFRGGLGINFSASRKASFFTELVFTGMSYFPKSSEVTASKINGVDDLKDLTTYYRKTEYAAEISQTSQAPQYTTPRQELRKSVPFGSIALNFGVRINFGRSGGQKSQTENPKQ